MACSELRFPSFSSQELRRLHLVCLAPSSRVSEQQMPGLPWTGGDTRFQRFRNGQLAAQNCGDGLGSNNNAQPGTHRSWFLLRTLFLRAVCRSLTSARSVLQHAHRYGSCSPQIPIGSLSIA